MEWRIRISRECTFFVRDVSIFSNQPMQLFIDETGNFKIKSSSVRFNVVAGLVLPESPSTVMDIVARQIAKLEESAPSSWRKNGELKGAFIPTDDLRRFLRPILDIQGPVSVVAAFIDQSYQVNS